MERKAALTIGIVWILVGSMFIMISPVHVLLGMLGTTFVILVDTYNASTVQLATLAIETFMFLGELFIAAPLHLVSGIVVFSIGADIIRHRW